jgi:phosphohistidine phosphatase
MKLLMVRHAIAVPRGTPGIPDDERPLTPRGERRFREAARGLARIARRPDAILSSPLPRALRTAEIAAKAWGRLEPKPQAALATDRVKATLDMLAKQPRDAMIAIVGHEPHLSTLLARLLGTTKSEHLTFRKGGAALVEIAGPPARGGRLLWFLTPKMLRVLARR